VRLARLLTVAAVVFVLVAEGMTPSATAAVPDEPSGSGQPDGSTDLAGDLETHDPALVKGGPGQNWYVFSTGDAAVGHGGIQIRTSPDGHDWTYAGTVWDSIPSWITKEIPGVNNLWAPEIHEYRGTYYLYYVASTFGTNDSLIALATNTTLDPGNPAYKWVDRGQVLRSTPDDDYNALDPAIIEDGRGRPWMAFGSYWSGIRMLPLDWPTGLVAANAGEPLRLADREEPPNAIEAPYIVHRKGWYYLFTSWDACCRGVDSTYHIVIGRSRLVTGPYLDRDGRSLLDGGGTTFLASSGDQIGPGGESASDGILAYHYYDAANGGEPHLGLGQLSWTADDWPGIIDARQ
jgi:arabinan endo-1,5-alpha-L-arabinosidase